MPAADTSVLLRLLVQSDPEATRRVRALARPGPLFVSRTVLMEMEWVLRAAYHLPPPLIHAALRGLLGLAELEFEAADEVARALAWFERGLDFTDALHLAAARDHGGLVTCDDALVELAGRLDAGPIAGA